MAKFKLGDYVTRKKEYIDSFVWEELAGKSRGKFLVVGFDGKSNFLLAGLTASWDQEKFDLVKQYDSKELEELHTMGYRDG